jgi:lipid-binding SYLF domain-containing protein
MMSCTGYGLGIIGSGSGSGSGKKTPQKGSNSSAASATGSTSQSSPLSIIEQWQRDAKGAVEDAYANFVLGDDTGESANLVLVASPSDDINLLENTGNGKHPPHILLNDPHTKRSRSASRNNGNSGRNGSNSNSNSNSNNNNNSSNNNSSNNNNNLLLFSHLDFYTNANRNSLMGLQRRGNYKKHDPHASSFMSCGVTFVEINGRAYVHALDGESDAYRSGVRPRDCVQYAAVLAKEWEDPLGKDFDPISSQALEREGSGQRINYEELKRVFLQGSGILGDHNAVGYGSGHGYGNGDDFGNNPNYPPHRSGDVVMGPPGSTKGYPPPLPTTIRIGKNPCGGLLNQNYDTDDGSTVLSNSRQGNGHPHHHQYQSGDSNSNSNSPSNSKNGNSNSNNNNNGLGDPSPVVLVFRRTRQRPARAWNVWPNYRLDDECDVACQILDSLTTAPYINASTESACGTSSPPSSPHSRRSNSKYQQDDETATSTIWTDNDGSTAFGEEYSYSSKRGAAGTGINKVLFSTDDRGSFKEARTKTRAGNLEEGSDNVEASTIRGMIAKAVGLAFVRSNKVVLGVSFHGGSGIVLSRLSDGTWSSPSLIGMAGMGLGLQVGLEVANYIFILQTQEALEHFSRGGSFTLGANVGAALAGMGREAVGAASVSPALCGIANPIQNIKEDEYNFENDEEDDYEYPKVRNNATCAGAGGCRPQADPGPTNLGECTSMSMNLNGNGGLAPIVAYAKSEGLYVGVSLEGSRIFARDEANAKAYKYSSYNHKTVTARDILTGKIVSRPYEAEFLYALLHDIELTHEWASLPAVPKSPWLVVPNNNNSRSASNEGDWTRPWDANSPAYLESNRPDDETLDEQLEAASESDLVDYASKYRDLLFGGITVTRISPLHQKREKRTLWLSSPSPADASSESNSKLNSNSKSPHKNNSSPKEPERSSLRVGFVSKLYSATAQRKHLSASIINDVAVQTSSIAFPGNPSGDGGSTVDSEMGDELTLDSALLDNRSLLTTTGTLQERVELSKKLSMDLVDVLCLTQMTPPNVRLEDSSERDRVICLESSNDTQLVFLGNTVEETKRLYCGLKLLLEKETTRMGIRGGRADKNKSGRKHKGGIASALKSKNGKSSSLSASSSKHRKSANSSSSMGYASSDIDDTDDGLYDPSEHYHASTAMTPTSKHYPLPEGWKSWGRVPGRSYMRAQSTSTDDGYPTYSHGQLLIRDVCKTVLLPLPLPLCRVLLLDSSSPVVSKWETERGDSDFERTPWTFPPATPREMEQFQSEHQLIASGSMCGAHRTISYERYRNGKPIRLSETHIVDSDDSEKLAFQVSERLPRRGFSIKVKILLRAVDNGSACEATVLGEIRPVGKNMSDPGAVHKALLKVLAELRNRYGTDCVGLLAGFMNVIENMPRDESFGVRSSSGLGLGLGATHSSSWRSGWEEKKEAENGFSKRVLEKTSVVKFEDVMNAELGIHEVPDARFAQERRPGNSSASDYKQIRNKPKQLAAGEMDTFGNSSADPVTIEVKPLPKIRLSLMPSPREEDEENLDEEGEPKNRRSSGNKSGSGGKKSSRSKSKRSPFGKKHRRKTSS